ncbi:type VII secretion target [Nocardia brasiliensis]|uniref:type VII secretion target n=1 Tax=Nocardia brasiliensis TaxID=37326 RepID=UPI0033CEFD5F
MAEELRVRPDQLDEFAAALADLAGQAGSAKDYAATWFAFGDHDGRIYAQVKGMLDEVRRNLESNYTHLRVLSETASTELAESAEMYRTTDLATAIRLDRTYVGVPK